MSEARLASRLRGLHTVACSCLCTGLALPQWAIINTGPGVSRVYRTVSSAQKLLVGRPPARNPNACAVRRPTDEFRPFGPPG